MKVAIWQPSSSQLLPIPTILPCAAIQSISISSEKCLILSQSNELYDLSLHSLALVPISLSYSIHSIFCTSSISMFIGSGRVFMQGADIEGTGILGNGLLKAEFPTAISINSYIIKGALSRHAAVIDNQGKLYTWGLGTSGQLGRASAFTEPCSLNLEISFKACEVVCGDQFTGVLTESCLVYILGSISSTHQNFRKSLLNTNLPVSHPDLERMTAIELAAGKDFLCILVEGGEIYAYDSCMELVKLPHPQGVKLQKVACSREIALGLGDGEIVEWAQGARKGEDNDCVLTSWVGRYYKLEKPYSQKTQLFQSQGKMCAMGFNGKMLGAMPLGIKAYHIKPYKRQEYTNKLIDCVFESLSPSNSPNIATKNLDKNFSDLTRLYSIEDNENAIKKIVKHRKEHELLKSLHKVMARKLEDLLKYALKTVKEWDGFEKRIERIREFVAPVEKIGGKRVSMNCMEVAKLEADKRIKEKIEIKGEKIGRRDAINETTKKIEELINMLAYKKLVYGFGMIRDLEMKSIQKKTAILFFAQLFSEKIKQIHTHAFAKIRIFINFSLKFVNILLKILMSKQKNVLKFIIHSSISNQQMSSTVIQKARALLCILRNRETRIYLIKWNKSVNNKNAMTKRKYCRQIAMKSIGLVLLDAVKRWLKLGYHAIKAVTTAKDLKIPANKLLSALQLSISDYKKRCFKLIKSLVTIEKSLKILARLMKKSEKYKKRFSLKKLEVYAASVFKATQLKLAVILYHSISKIFSRHLQATWKSLSQSIVEPFSNYLEPDFSFYSPTTKFQRFNLLKTRQLSSRATGEDTPQSSFPFNEDPNRFKRLKATSKSLTSLQSPIKQVILTTNESVRPSPFESVLQQSLNKKKMNAVLANRQILGKPPLNPPWKPAKTIPSHTGKNPINSTMRRSEYSGKLKQRLKGHSKTASYDMIKTVSTLNISRNSSREKDKGKKMEDRDRMADNFMFAVMVLDNVKQMIIRKNLYEGLCSIKSANRFSPNPPAPRPLDSEPARKPSWKSNLYKIGMERLKKILKLAVGREIINRLKGITGGFNIYGKLNFL